MVDWFPKLASRVVPATVITWSGAGGGLKRSRFVSDKDGSFTADLYDKVEYIESFLLSRKAMLPTSIQAGACYMPLGMFCLLKSVIEEVVCFL